MGAVIFGYIVGLLFFVNTTAVPYWPLQIINIFVGVWFVVVSSIAGWQHYNRD